MNYFGMPLGMWLLFKGSFQKNMTVVLGFDQRTAAEAAATGMVALAAASFSPDLTLTIAMTPPDFIMERFYQGNKDGAKEWPSNGSSLSWQGQPLPYLPYACRHPQYWNQIMEDSKASGDRTASRPMFEESERLYPVREEERIKVENIKGKVIFVGAEDGVLWDTCKYIRRMMKRLDTLPHDCTAHTLYFLSPC